MNGAISKALSTSRPVKINKALRDEISHWFSLRTWEDPLPWRDERHIRITLATDASASGGWGGSVTLGDRIVQVSDYWTGEEQGLDIATKRGSGNCQGSFFRSVLPQEHMGGCFG